MFHACPAETERCAAKPSVRLLLSRSRCKRKSSGKLGAESQVGIDIVGYGWIVRGWRVCHCQYHDFEARGTVTHKLRGMISIIASKISMASFSFDKCWFPLPIINACSFQSQAAARVSAGFGRHGVDYSIDDTDDGCLDVEGNDVRRQRSFGGRVSTCCTSSL